MFDVGCMTFHNLERSHVDVKLDFMIFFFKLRMFIADMELG